MPWGAIPWPDDLYLQHGLIAARDLPFADTAIAADLETSLDALDGAGLRPTIVIEFEGELDAQSLPADPAASLLPAASVFLVDVDSRSPSAFERVPLRVELAPDRRTLRARVAFERALHPGRRYAAVATTALRARASNRAVAPARRLERILDRTTPLDEALDQRAREHYGPVVRALEVKRLRAEDIVALAVFTPQLVGSQLDSARQALAAAPLASLRVRRFVPSAALGALLGTQAPAAGIAPGRGVAHAHLWGLVDLELQAPVLAEVREGRRRAPVLDERGNVVLGATAPVPCTLALPRALESGAALPVVLVQHGLRGDRSDALPLANELAAAGHAVLSCDAPLHGTRVEGSDVQNRFTGELSPDGFGDQPGDLLAGSAESWPDGHPLLVRDAFVQNAVEWMALVRVLSEGGLDELLSEVTGLPDVQLARTDLGFVGMDVGGEVGLAVAAREGAVTAVVSAFTGGRGLDDWIEGPDYAPLREPVLQHYLGSDLRASRSALRADVGVLRMFADGASGLGHAAAFRRSRANLLMLVADRDERVPRASSEALAYALGASLVGAQPQSELALRTEILLSSGAIIGNTPLGRGAVTRVTFVVDGATHRALVTRDDVLRFEHPLETDAVELARPRTATNPTQSLLSQIAFYFASYRTCRAEQSDASEPCAAAVRALDVRTR